MIRPNDRPADVVAFEESLVAFFLEAAVILGVPKSLAAIYGVIFASPEPLSFSEVQERLDISAGSISQGLRVLHEVGALRIMPSAETAVVSGPPPSVVSPPPSAVRPPSSSSHVTRHSSLATGPSSLVQRSSRPRERFEPDLELRKLIAHYLEQRVEKQLDSGRGRLQAIAKAIPDGADGSAKVLRARLKSLQGWHDKSRSALPMIKTLLKLTS